MKPKRLFAVMLCIITIVSCIGCGKNNAVKEDASEIYINEEVAEKLKYIFLFIGDGMSYPQFQLASDYLGAIADDDYKKALPSLSYENRSATLDGPVELNFMSFDEVGTAVTFDSCSFAPDSAAAGTA